MISRSNARPSLYTMPLGVGVMVVASLIPEVRELLIPEFESGLKASLALRAIWWLSIGFIAGGLGFGLRDSVRLSREWRSIKRAEKNKHTLASESKGTVMALRYSAVEGWKGKHDAPPPTRWFDSKRVQAATSLDSVGATTRFIAGTLLLLAVVGTFAGMKAALPKLNDAIRGQSRPQQFEDSAARGDALGQALQYVEEAFGANFVALLGSLALGILGFGASTERRHLLHRIEAASDDCLYPDLPQGLDTASLDLAVGELHEGVFKLSSVATSIGDLDGSLGSYTDTLKGALDEVRKSFSSGLRDEVAGIFVALESRFNSATAEIHAVATSVAQTAVAYEGLTQVVKERHVDLQAAERAMTQVGNGLVEQMSAVAGSMATAVESFQESQQTLFKKGDAVADEIWAARESLTSIMTKLGGSISALEEKTGALAEAAGAVGSREEQFLETLLARNQELIDLVGESQRVAEANLGKQSAAIVQGLSKSDEFLNELVTRQQVMGEVYERVVQELQDLGVNFTGTLERSASNMAALQERTDQAVDANLARSERVADSLGQHLTRVGEMSGAANEVAAQLANAAAQLARVERRMEEVMRRKRRSWWPFSRG